MSAHIASADAHAAVLLCSRSYKSGALGLAFQCEHDAGHTGDCGPRESAGEVDGDAPYESFICDLLVFGSRAWTDKRRIAYLLETVRPYSVIEGEANGADAIARNEAMARDIVVRRFPVDNAIDGAWPAAGHKRNARMYRDGAPSLAAGFVTGKVGSPLSKGSEGMASVIRRAGKVPLAIYREDGIEPLARADEPLEHRLAVAGNGRVSPFRFHSASNSDHPWASGRSCNKLNRDSARRQREARRFPADACVRRRCLGRTPAARWWRAQSPKSSSWRARPV